MTFATKFCLLVSDMFDISSSRDYCKRKKTCLGYRLVRVHFRVVSFVTFAIKKLVFLKIQMQKTKQSFIYNKETQPDVCNSVWSYTCRSHYCIARSFLHRIPTGFILVSNELKQASIPLYLFTHLDTFKRNIKTHLFKNAFGNV